MAELTADIFRDFFAGSWSGKITRNGEFQREIVFNWPKAFGKYSSLGTEEGALVPPNRGVLDNTKQIALSGWRCDVRRWCHMWHNEFGGYGEIQWTSQEEVDGIRVIYGFGHECKQECDDPTDHILKCELLDQDNFKYTVRSFRKGLLEIAFSRRRTGSELNDLLGKQTDTAIGFDELFEL